MNGLNTPPPSMRINGINGVNAVNTPPPGSGGMRNEQIQMMRMGQMQSGQIGHSSPIPGDPTNPVSPLNYQMQHHHQIASAQMMNMVNPVQSQMVNMAQFQGNGQGQHRYQESKDSEPNLNWGPMDMGGSHPNLNGPYAMRNIYKKESQSLLSGSTVLSTIPTDKKVSLSQSGLSKLATQPLPPVIADPFDGTNPGPENIV